MESWSVAVLYFDPLTRLHCGSAGCFLRTYLLRMTGRWDDTIGASKLLGLQVLLMARALNLVATICNALPNNALGTLNIFSHSTEMLVMGLTGLIKIG